MAPEVLVALITAGQAITLAFIGVLTSRLGKVKTAVGEVKADAAAAREQVENNHDTNLREENDSRHAETKGWIDDLRSAFTGQFATITRDIGGLREEIRIDRHTNGQRFNNIEDRMKKEP